MALTYIDGIERELEQNDTDSVEFQDQYKERLKSLLTEIHDNYMAEMCKGATTQSPPESIRTKDITVTMIKTELSKGSEEKFVFDQRERSLFEASNVKLMDGAVLGCVLARRSWSPTSSLPPRTGWTSPPRPGSARSTTSGCSTRPAGPT